MQINIRVKKVQENAAIPVYATNGSAGLDLQANLTEPLTIDPGKRIQVGTGLAIEIPPAYVGLIFARSGLASRHGISLANGVGVIDSDYRGELRCALQNTSGEAYTVHPGDRIAQLVFVPVVQANLQLVAELTDTTRGSGGFGSTGA